MSGKKLKEGTYRGVLLLDEANHVELPFNFDVKYKGKKPLIIIRNADEKIEVAEITIDDDSVNFKMPVFDTEFKTVLKGDNLEGVWINHYRTNQNIIKFTATFGQSKRFLFEPGKPDPLFEGRWEVGFSPNTKEMSKAVGLFHHLEQSDYLVGTFLTETGDYRYLEGMKHGNKIYLSCFDGSHAFLFTGEYNGSWIADGKFYSGSHWQENWLAERNENFTLRNPNDITLVRDKNKVVDFTIPNLENKNISLSDKKYQNKPVIIQLMGSWCPNCMDESAYLADIYKEFKGDGLEVIALAFEKADSFERAVKQITRLKDRFDMRYEILVTLKTGKNKASELFPEISEVSAFPTTLFLNREHKIVKVHTGFSGPATGSEYTKFKEDTENLIKLLLKE